MIKRILGNKGLVTMVAMIVCIAIIFFAYRYRVNKEIHAVSVPYAAKMIPSRTEITEDMVSTVKVASAMITSSVIQRKEDVIGKYVNYNTQIPAGSLFYKSVIVNWEDMPDSAWTNIENGKTIVSLSVSADDTLGNSVFPGDIIDLYYDFTDENGIGYGKLIEGIKVLAVKDSSGKHIFKKSAEQKSAAALIFAVDENLHILFRQAMEVGGSSSIKPVLRNRNYDPGKTTVKSEYIYQFIKRFTKDVPQDTVSTTQTANE